MTEKDVYHISLKKNGGPNATLEFDITDPINSVDIAIR
jgi:hypothetical protein